MNHGTEDCLTNEFDDTVVMIDPVTLGTRAIVKVGSSEPARAGIGGSEDESTAPRTAILYRPRGEGQA